MAPRSPLTTLQGPQNCLFPSQFGLLEAAFCTPYLPSLQAIPISVAPAPSLLTSSSPTPAPGQGDEVTVVNLSYCLASAPYVGQKSSRTSGYINRGMVHRTRRGQNHSSNSRAQVMAPLCLGGTEVMSIVVCPGREGTQAPQTV